MSLLDDLKAEAEKLHNQQSSEEGRKAKQEANYIEEINPKLQMIAAYLGELSEQLNILKPETNPTYAVPGYQLVKGFVQQDYSVNADSMEKIKQLRFRFNAELPHDIEFSVTPKTKADETRHFLEHQSFTFSEWPVRDMHQRLIGLTFLVKLKVEILFLFQADIENGEIQLTIVNFEGFTVSTKNYRPQSIHDDWLEGLGHYILRKKNALHTLEISDEMKEQLRAKLKQAEQGRENEMKEMDQIVAQEAAEQEQGENRFVKIFKNTIKGKE